MVFVVVERTSLAEDLWAYGEDELAIKALDLSPLEVARVGVLAGRLYTDPSEPGMMLAKACALAAIEVLEGEHRPLKRKRRRSVPEPPREHPLPPPPGEDVPRDVFLAAAANLAERFVERGFRYAKSGPHISRRCGEFTFLVHFANHYNLRGVEIELTLYAGVESNRLRRWRQEHWPPDWPPSKQASTKVAGSMLQNLGVEMPITHWNADPNERAAILDELKAAITDVALPYFALFEDADALVSRLQVVPIDSFGALSAIEWLLSHGRRESALRHIRLVLGDDRLRRAYERARTRMERGQLEVLPYVHEAEALAYAALAYDLDF